MNSIFSPQFFETVGHGPGEDLEYTPAFAEFMALAVPREERQVGEHVIPAQAPDWSGVFKTGSALLEQSHDLRILAVICQAALSKYSLPGLAQSLSLMAQWIENEWDSIYPLLTIDGDYDPLFRSNAISGISDREGLVAVLRQTTLLETPIGSITISTAEHLVNGKPVGEEVAISSLNQLSRIVVEEKGRNQERLAAIISISASLTAISSAYKARLESEYWPDIELLTGIITRIERFIAPLFQDTAPSDQQDAAPAHNDTAATTTASTGTKSTPAAALPAALDTRIEAFKALALARQYFENHEPTHPAPLLIQRIERLSSLDFSAIIQDLIPEGLQQLRILTGEQGEQGEQGDY
ncbi:MAG: type VI secretion system protein TssA [Azoarcus sp.]|jgi:type VI secretion system protein ImpA|nr:type VI secretion system protein TssA [Azoarcus sp.]